LEVFLNEDYTFDLEGIGRYGTWDLIYDTGFELNFEQGDLKFFATFDYWPTGDKKYTTNCSATSVGWYHFLEIG